MRETPLFWKVKRSLPGPAPIDAPAALSSEWDRLGLDGRVAGKSIALGLGSRGISDLVPMARALVDRVKAAGGEPFIVPAMGSHGGATAEGQAEVLAGLGITADSMGCPIKATMDTVELGTTAGGLPARLDRHAAEADGILFLNRVKRHTSFHGPLESGLHKMLAIGLGKEKAATLLHARGPDSLRDDMPEVARALLRMAKVLAGFGVVEDGHHRIVAARGLAPAEMEAGERELLEISRALSPGLPFGEVDVLVVDEMGKDISGTGMDTNVIGRLRIAGRPEPDSPRVKALVALDLTEATHGNALGIGLADFTVRALLDKVDWRLTAANVLASGFLERGKVPLVLPDPAEALAAAIGHVHRGDPEGWRKARVLRIRNTLALEEFRVSESLLEEARAMPGFLEATGPEPFR
jgi:hypothetical protein